VTNGYSTFSSADQSVFVWAYYSSSLYWIFGPYKDVGTSYAYAYVTCPSNTSVCPVWRMVNFFETCNNVFTSVAATVLSSPGKPYHTLICLTRTTFCIFLFKIAGIGCLLVKPVNVHRSGLQL